MAYPTLNDVIATTTRVQALKPDWLFEVVTDERKIPFVVAEHPLTWIKVSFRWERSQWSCRGDTGEVIASFGDLAAAMLWGLRLAFKAADDGRH